MMLLGQSLQLVSGFSLELPVGLLLFAVLSSLMDFDEEYEEETEGVVGDDDDYHDPPVGLKSLGVLVGEEAEEEEGVEPEKEEGIQDAEEAVQSLGERTAGKEEPHFNNSQK